MERLNNLLPNSDPLGQGYNPLNQATMKADTYNNSPGNLSGVDCPKCFNKGSIAYPREDGGIFFRECSCMVMRQCIWKMEKSGLKNVIRDCSFDKFESVRPWQETALEMARNYANIRQGWFLICGQSGSGKTHLCTAICRELLLDGKQVVYMSWRQDAADLKAMSMDAEARVKKQEELKKAEYLYIDDLFKTGANADGAVRPTSADIGLAFELVNYRYVNHLPTLFSSELYPEELLQIDEATGGRIIERARGNILVIGKDTSKNYRLKGVVMV